MWLLLILLAGCTRWQASEVDVLNIPAQIEGGAMPVFVGNDPRSLEVWDWTREFYALRQFQPAWFHGEQLLPSAATAVEVLEKATEEGLNPDILDALRLRAALSASANVDKAARTEFELHLTHSLVRYVSQLCFGRTDPRDLDKKWPEKKSNCDVPALTQEAIAQNAVEQLAEQLSPTLPEFQGLRAALRRYRDVAAHGGWKPLPAKSPGADIVLTDPSLQERLKQSGDLQVDESGVASEDAVKEALQQARLRHGLDPTGGLDEKLLAALSVPVEQRIEQIAINMDRMRWSASFEPTYIRVNIPGFHLSVHENDQVPLQMRVIVGSKEDPTPVIDSKMDYLVFSPYWNVPLSIAKEELLPKIKSNPDYLRDQQLEVIRTSGGKVQTVNPSRIDWDEVSNGEFQLRQKPGVQNALGLVKFIFPNPHQVYLHDTPTDNLFDRLTRTMSHGCVRLERPVDLAAYLLRDQPEWTMQKIDSAMHAGKEQKVPLLVPLPVHLVYWTAWGDANGQVHFREDVYGHDATHSKKVIAAGREPGESAPALEN